MGFLTGAVCSLVIVGEMLERSTQGVYNASYERGAVPPESDILCAGCHSRLTQTGQSRESTNRNRLSRHTVTFQCSECHVESPKMVYERKVKVVNCYASPEPRVVRRFGSRGFNQEGVEGPS